MAAPLPPPYRLEDNEYSMLDETDLVFIDPVSTGYSRAIPPKDATKFHGLHEDAASVADFIRLYVTPPQPLGFAQVYHRRKLRHNPRPRPFREN